ncbi:MAG: alpha/beta hydrolase [Alphaproteobacteria bacterium]|nr:alpha/beta hydrolase [Alphaproteobacteria bacterium]
MMAEFLETPAHPLAYRTQEGSGPTVMFCTGFMSDMAGTKAETLSTHCAARGQSFIRFDYSGHGQSGGDFMDGTIGQWKRDTLAVLDELTEGPVVLVGSSMGAWLALLAAMERPERIKALIGISAAPDFTERLIWQKLAAAQQQELLEKGVFYAPSCYGEAPYPITRRLIEEARSHLLITPSPSACAQALRRDKLGGGSGLRPPKPLDIGGWRHPRSDGENNAPLLTSPLQGEDIPIHLLHGTRDEDVPVEIAHLLVERLKSSSCGPQRGSTVSMDSAQPSGSQNDNTRIQLALIEGGNHRLSEPEDLRLLCRTVCDIS